MTDLPRMDFSTFLISMGTSAQIHLGVIGDPTTGKTHVDLEHARQAIDILELLQEKTKGNLNKQEDDLLGQLLYELRLLFIEKKKSN